MTDPDIVTRLRGHIAMTTRLHYAKDGYPEPVYVHGPSPICQEAADEIERLRNERNAFEAERDELVRISNKLKHERDEARRLYCVRCSGSRAMERDIAIKRGWVDLYPEGHGK
jgi:hypothetical protein